jgi:ADP-L-glycero-D-manno-heptose 6-epimerase
MYVVTGGAGFIGSNIVASLVERGEEVVVSDRLRSGAKWRNLARHEFSDLIEPDALLPWLRSHGRGVRAVLHMGAISSTTESDADLIYATNVRLTLALTEWCTERGVPLIAASSAATYGGGEAGFEDDASPGALARLRPLNPYGWSKLVVDRTLARRARLGEPLPPQWVMLRFFNVYGPNEYHKGGMRSVVAQAWEQLSEGKPVRLFRSHRPEVADGGQLRDFVHVQDCVELILWLLENPQVSGILNCGTGQARSFLDLVHAVHRAAGRDPRIEWVDTPEVLRARYQYFTEASLTRLRAAGYHRPFRSLEDGVTEYVQRFLATGDPYR